MSDDRSGFQAAALLGAPSARGWFDLHVVGFSGNRPVGRATTIFIPGFEDGLALPPAHLMQRVANSTSPEIFRLGGLRTAGIFFEAILRHADAAGVKRLLDWGSGCGRVSSLFAKYFRTGADRDVAGCDIDAEGVEWCARNVPGGRFVTIRPDPPTPFKDGEFDAISGYSVMTHLDRNRQVAWLRELKRLLRKGGLLLVSVHGESAARYAERRELVSSLATRGIVDEIDDPNLDGVAPQGYYRETYQARAWTEATWGREMEVVEYVERGMGGFQDLVVLLKR
jgi:SAM-dependent methyltransferase